MSKVAPSLIERVWEGCGFCREFKQQDTGKAERQGKIGTRQGQDRDAKPTQQGSRWRGERCYLYRCQLIIFKFLAYE